MTKTTWALGLAALLALLIGSSTFQVGENESVIVSRFGDPRRRVDEAGLHLKWPPPVDALLRVDRRIRVLDQEPQEYLTADKKNVLVSCFLAWRVEDPLRFIQSASDPARVEDRLRDLVHTQAGSVLGEHPLGALVSVDADENALAAVNAAIAERTAAEAGATYGVEVVAARVRRLSFPTQNRKAVFRRMEAERQKIAQEIRSEGVERAEGIRAEAELEAAVILSEARRVAEELRGQGEAEAARIYNEAYAQDPRFYELLRTLEAYEEIFDDDARIVLPSDSELLRVLSGEGVLTGRDPAPGPFDPGELDPEESGPEEPEDSGNPDQ